MDHFTQRVYVTEVKSQSRFALSAVGALNHALRGAQEPGTASIGREHFHAEVFRQTHSFLTHASNISRLFWPPKARAKKGEMADSFSQRAAFTEGRGIALRGLFSIEDESPLKDRTLRDHLEHYDERLDHWSTTSLRRNIASDTIGPPNAIVGLDSADTMRWFDPSSNTFRFRGETYGLQPLATAIDLLPSKAVELEERLWIHQRA